MKTAVVLCLGFCVTAGLSGCAAFNHSDPRARQIDTFIGNDMLNARRHNVAVDRILGRRVESQKPLPDSNRTAAVPVDCTRPLAHEDRILSCS